MKEATVSPGPVVHFIDSPIPSPQKGEVLIEVFAVGANPKDWYVTIHSLLVDLSA